MRTNGRKSSVSGALLWLHSADEQTGRACEQTWYPISKLGWFTGHTRKGVTVIRHQLELLQPARARPYLALKERAIARTAPQDVPPGRYQPPDAVTALACLMFPPKP